MRTDPAASGERLLCCPLSPAPNSTQQHPTPRSLYGLLRCDRAQEGLEVLAAHEPLGLQNIGSEMKTSNIRPRVPPPRWASGQGPWAQTVRLPLVTRRQFLRRVTPFGRTEEPRLGAGPRGSYVSATFHGGCLARSRTT